MLAVAYAAAAVMAAVAESPVPPEVELFIAIPVTVGPLLSAITDGGDDGLDPLVS